MLPEREHDVAAAAQAQRQRRDVAAPLPGADREPVVEGVAADHAAGVEVEALLAELGPGARAEAEVHRLVGRHLEVGEDEAMQHGRPRVLGIAGLGQRVAFHATTCARTMPAYSPPRAISVSCPPDSTTRPSLRT